MLLRILAHHQEAADPDLLDAIKHRLDSILGLGPETIVAVLALVILAVPVAILVMYARRRTNS